MNALCRDKENIPTYNDHRLGRVCRRLTFNQVINSLEVWQCGVTRGQLLGVVGGGARVVIIL